jgi:hypothetical protein
MRPCKTFLYFYNANKAYNRMDEFCIKVIWFLLSDSTFASYVVDCTVYGSTYIAHPGHYFQVESIDISNQKTALDCITWCTNTDTCRGCNHSPTYDTGGWCSMQTSTPRTLPGDFNESGSNFTYYLRNCA